MNRARVTIGVAAQLLGVSTKTLRHYQRLGLLADVHRDENGYRTFGAADLLRAQQIRRLQSLGLSLAQIQALLGAPDDEPSLRSALTRLLAEVEAQLAQLEARRALLARLVSTDVLAALDDHTPSPTARLFEEALETAAGKATPWMRDADARLLAQIDFVLGNDAAYSAHMHELARLAAANPAAYQELIALGRRLEALGDADPRRARGRRACRSLPPCLRGERGAAGHGRAARARRTQGRSAGRAAGPHRAGGALARAAPGV